MNLGARIALVVGLAAAAGLFAYSWFGPQSGGKRAALEAELTRLREENRALAEENRLLDLQIRALRGNRVYQEQVVRDVLGLVRPGEWVFYLQPDPPDAGPPAQDP
ncbi:MAG: hypothetical protein GYA21_02235 [Myxococcales bacterium]|nr:hypothetical protein [Myxococcales bacterium]